MFIWGKLLGAVFGYFVGEYLGAIVGFIIGHQLDVGVTRAMAYDHQHGPKDPAETQHVFFTTVFSIMGHLAKADGRVTTSEIESAQSIMHQMNLSSEQKKQAIDLFTRGKAADFPFGEVIDEFQRVCGRNPALKQMFIEILLFCAYSDGTLHTNEQHILMRICRMLGISQGEFAQIESMIRAQQSFHSSYGSSSGHQSSGSSRRATQSVNLIDEAYKALGVSSLASDSEIKKAYRRLMSKHHPDKLAAKGLPDEMIKIATEQTQEIQKAYDTIVEARKR